MDFTSNLNACAAGLDFARIGWTPLREPVSLSLYKDWLKAGYHASMDYLERHLPIKENPELLLPNALSAVVVAKTYYPHPFANDEVISVRTAMYARGTDYHSRFLEELEIFRSRLEARFVCEKFLCFTDSAPVLERDLAARAGLGWVGKNTCVIHPQNGSLFFIGEIFTTAQFAKPQAQIADMCGTCDRCITACPTQAIVAPRVLDAGKCISYWTIEARTPAPVELREKFGDWFFGCDICQTVCPWNEKVFGREPMRLEAAPVLPRSAAVTSDLRALLNATPKELRERFRELPYSRARSLGLKRNALYVAGNLRLKELKPEIQACMLNPDLREIAEWALARLDCEALL